LRRNSLIEAKDIALRVAGVAKSKKAQRVLALDMRKICTFCDYFVILSATSLKQVNAFAEAITEDLAKIRIKSLSKRDSHNDSGWVVLDYSSVIVHIFFKPLREFYSLERLWADAKRMRLPRV